MINELKKRNIPLARWEDYFWHKDERPEKHVEDDGYEVVPGDGVDDFGDGRVEDLELEIVGVVDAPLR